MSDYITALTAAGTATAVGLTAVARTWSAARPRVRTVLDEASLEELLGPWPEPVFGAALAQGWRPCPGSCGGEMPSVLHRDGWTCGSCLTTTTTQGD